MTAKGFWTSLLSVLLVTLLAVGVTAGTGAWIDEIVLSEEPAAEQGVAKLAAGDIELFAMTLTDADLFAQVRANDDIDYFMSVGSYNEFSLNPVGPIFPGTGKFNPFAIREIREAVHWAIDRDFIVNELMRGLAVPRFTPISGQFADGVDRYPDLIEAIEEYYAYDLDKAAEIIREQMLQQDGVTWENDKWHYNGEVIDIVVLTRVEDERSLMGPYFADQMTALGFNGVVDFKTAGEASPIWIQGDPAAGLFHVYTGGWISTVIARDEGGNAAFFQTNLGLGWSPLWQAYESTAEFYASSFRLYEGDWTTMEERRELISENLWQSMEDGHRIFLCDNTAFMPHSAKIGVAGDTAGSISGSWLWAETIHFKDAAGDPTRGGTLRVNVPSMLTAPWNPIGGSNWIFDMMIIRATQDMPAPRDTRTGLPYAHMFERAELTLLEGTPISVDPVSDWIDVNFVDEIVVPGDAWYRWDALAQKFITVDEAYALGMIAEENYPLTARRKSVVYYSSDLYNVPLHDGSTISAADFVLGMILTFDRADELSAIYDSGAVAGYTSFISSHRGWRITSTNPLVIESYNTGASLDAELGVATFFPNYAQGPGFWHVLALGILAEEEGKTAFTSAKALAINGAHLSYIAGPSMPILAGNLFKAIQTGYLPYEPTLGKYVDFGEASERWGNLERWYNSVGHFWVASGPFYLNQAFPTEKAIVLRRFADYPHSSDKWMFLLEPLAP